MVKSPSARHRQGMEGGNVAISHRCILVFDSSGVGVSGDVIYLTTPETQLG